MRRLARLRAALRRFAPHVLHTILSSGNSYGRLAALGLGIPVVIAAERVVTPCRAWQVMVERALDRVTDAYLVNCEAIAAWQVERKRLPREKIEVISNGIDLGRLPPFSLDRRAARSAAGLRRDRRLVAGVGRLDAQKDFPTFLRAAAMIAAEVPDVDCLVVGGGGVRPSLPREAARRLLRPGTRAAHPRACAPPPLPALREIAALRALLPHARAVRGLRAPLRARAGVLRRRHLHQLCGDGRGRGGHRARARLDRRADARPAARDRGGARRAGPARVLPPCAEPVARDQLPGGDGGATARAGAAAGAVNARAVRGEGACLAHACPHRPGD